MNQMKQIILHFLKHSLPRQLLKPVLRDLTFLGIFDLFNVRQVESVPKFQVQ